MRSLLRVGIRPLKNARISFGVQLALVFFWLLYGGFMLYSGSETDRNYLSMVFLVLAFLYLVYILAQNTSILGTQSYLEITPAYIVQKKGYFRPKQVIAFEDVKNLVMLPNLLRFSMKDGSTETMDLKLIKRKKNLALVKEKLQLMAERHRFDITETGLPK